MNHDRLSQEGASFLRAAGIGAKLLVALLGFTAIVWYSNVLGPIRLAAAVTGISDRILENERFKSEVLLSTLSRADSAAESDRKISSVSRARTVVLLSLAEDALKLSSAGGDIDNSLEAPENALRLSLELNPSDSFLWLMMYSLKNLREGFDPRHIPFLDRSYTTGPLEGWVALRRNRLALLVFPALSDQTRELVIAEFAGLVSAKFIEEAASNLTTVGWPYRNEVLPALHDVDIAQREALAYRVGREGLKAPIPGVSFDDRPWR
ncbi:hypothetical protein [Bradyrhizobium guangzhouense]|uniref:hypothetical protein n=1 Tax=Bradyrhizobium guangzhouense TaxID=1325095 RepID=UPI001009C6D3|nr:hypothetical protein [Bradyrhizobium guangzhouense]